jgi:hypothetical protein
VNAVIVGVQHRCARLRPSPIAIATCTHVSALDGGNRLSYGLART